MLKKACITVLALGLILAGVADAAPSESNPISGPYLTRTKVSTSQHSQALLGSAYTGAVNSNDEIRDMCYVVGDSWNGSTMWDLVYNKATGVAGFVSETEIRDDLQVYNCYSSDQGGYKGNYYRTHTKLSTSIHSQALLGSTYVGMAQPTDILLDLCYVTGDEWRGTRFWNLVYNRATGVAGFISISEIDNPNQGFECYSNS
ncbi:hypothetical protein ACFQ05_18635 [Amycolatopsis umgeniensis]|uniref:Uncharacterized protein n=1 Tax=Amycolatopsis umgeniensis TaxID=336628 RepID=A0A841BE56_9PSEU|nr:hypothetical protein [Amycolatopsis umgeniensis]MBB5857627.1 hypothetical protein [Amycolatopsis umgeniensis]